MHAQMGGCHAVSDCILQLTGAASPPVESVCSGSLLWAGVCWSDARVGGAQVSEPAQLQRAEEGAAGQC